MQRICCGEVLDAGDAESAGAWNRRPPFRENPVRATLEPPLLTAGDPPGTRLRNPFRNNDLTPIVVPRRPPGAPVAGKVADHPRSPSALNP
jgi:hypothetical protein